MSEDWVAFVIVTKAADNTATLIQRHQLIFTCLLCFCYDVIMCHVLALISPSYCCMLRQFLIDTSEKQKRWHWHDLSCTQTRTSCLVNQSFPGSTGRKFLVKGGWALKSWSDTKRNFLAKASVLRCYSDLKAFLIDNISKGECRLWKRPFKQQATPLWWHAVKAESNTSTFLQFQGRCRRDCMRSHSRPLYWGWPENTAHGRWASWCTAGCTSKECPASNYVLWAQSSTN